MTDISLSDLSLDSLKRALAIRENIELLERELAALVSKGAPAKIRGNGTRRKMSPEARAKIAAAQTRRWAKIHGAKGAVIPAGPKTRRKMSAAAKAKIAAAARARWAAAKAANRNSLAAA